MASKKKDVRPVITLQCNDCKERNYTTEKNRRNDPNRMELKKYCGRCKKHTVHRETTGELRKVSWPTWPEARRLTLLVLLVMVVVGLFLAGVDALAAELLTLILI